MMERAAGDTRDAWTAALLAVAAAARGLVLRGRRARDTARGVVTGPLPGSWIEAAGFGLVALAAFDLARPLGLLVSGVVLIAVGNDIVKTRRGDGRQR